MTDPAQRAESVMGSEGYLVIALQLQRYLQSGQVEHCERRQLWRYQDSFYKIVHC